MVRDHILQTLSAEFGRPLGSTTLEWWIVVGPQRPPVHVCLNERGRENTAHILVFDPAAVEGRSVIEDRPTSIAEADAVLSRIRRIVHGRD